MLEDIYEITEEDDSGNNCIISKNKIEPIIKSRVKDFIVGFLFSTLYVLNAPKVVITEPPIKIPYKYSILYSGFVGEKTNQKKTPIKFHIQLFLLRLKFHIRLILPLAHLKF